MKFLVFLILVAAVIGLSIDDKNQRDALENVSQERDQAQIQVQKVTQQLQDYAKLARSPATPPSWFQERLEQKPVLTSPPGTSY